LVFGGNLDLSEDGRFFAETNLWGPGEEALRLYYFSREEGLLWTRKTELGVVEASLDLADNGGRVAVTDRRAGSLVIFDSLGREVFRLGFQSPTSNGALLGPGNRVLIAASKGVLLIDTESGDQQLLWQPDAGVRMVILEERFLALVYGSTHWDESVALATLGRIQ
jgi:hypothetical protein